MEVVSFILIGAVVSLLIQFLKNKFGTSSNITLSIVVGLSVIIGSIYYFVKDTSLWEPIVSILAFAGAVYTFIIKRFETTSTE